MVNGKSVVRNTFNDQASVAPIRSVNCRIQWIIESLNANGAPGQDGSTSVWASFSLKCKPCVCTGLRSCRVPIQVTGIPWSRALSVADSQVQESCLRFDFCAGLLLRAHFCTVGPQINTGMILPIIRGQKNVPLFTVCIQQIWKFM